MTYGPAGYSPQQPPPNYQYPGYQAPRPNAACGPIAVVAAILGVVAFLIVGCCGGFVVFLYLGTTRISDDIKEQLQQNPILIQHVGEVKSVTLEPLRSAQVPESDIFFYRVVGDKGQCSIRVQQYTDELGRERIADAVMIKPNGEKVNLFPPPSNRPFRPNR